MDKAGVILGAGLWLGAPIGTRLGHDPSTSSGGISLRPLALCSKVRFDDLQAVGQKAPCFFAEAQ